MVIFTTTRDVNYQRLVQSFPLTAVGITQVNQFAANFQLIKACKKTCVRFPGRMSMATCYLMWPSNADEAR